MQDESEPRKQAEDGFKEDLYHSVIGQVKDYAIFRIDVDGHPVTWNQGVQLVLGFEESDFIGHDITRIFTPEDIAAGVPQRELEEAARAGSASNDRWMRRKSGERFYAYGRTTALFDPAGRLLGYTKVMRDGTERKAMEDRQCELLEELALAHRRKDEFLATLSHELRNPLAPLRHGLELMRTAEDPGTREQVIALVDRQFNHLVRLIDDLMDVSRISRDKVRLQRRHVLLHRIIQETVETSQVRMDECGHRFSVQVPEGRVLLNVDRARIVQVLGNLLTNAAKYTEPGGNIRLAVEVEDNKVVFIVQDDGIGIPPERQADLFELFSQVQGDVDRTQGGLGIGLNLVKRLAEMHGGTVEAHSEGTGQGSTFIVRLPAVVGVGQEEAEITSRPSTPPQGHSVLVVDDNVDGATSLAMLLKRVGCTTALAHDGEEALAMADQFRPQVVMLDIGLPRMDGYAVARAIRSNEWGKSMLLLAITGWGQEEDKRKAQEAGFDRHLTKPVDPGTVLEILAALPAESGNSSA